MAAAWLFNTAWMGCCAAEAWAFRRATRRVEQTQAAVLAAILRRNRETQFGRTHRFDAIDSPRTYQERVPISHYEDYAEAVRRIGEGSDGVLTRDPVTLLEPTSGTTAAVKLIPYTASLRREFQRAVAAWVFDLLWHRPALRRGRAYWSISPAVGDRRRSPAGIPIGFDDDAAYLATVQRRLVERLLVVPPAVAGIGDIDLFRYATLWFLLQADDLTSISVWNPSFLTSLLAPLEAWHERLCFDLREGRPRGPSGDARELVEATVPRRPGAVRRAAELEDVFRSGGTWADKLRRVWPMLGLISCWADAGAAMFLDDMRSLFPDVEIQPKGLMATEACVSFPLLGRPGAALALRSHFLEFQEAGGQRVRLAHELQPGGRYGVMATTGGGLYRYQLRDQIEVVGFIHDCPLVQFVGKIDCTSDLVGEKLAEPHVRAVIERTMRQHGLAPRFALVVPVADRPPRYRLYFQTGETLPEIAMPGDVAAALEAGLCENPHYAYARRLGQLATAEVRRLSSAGEPGWEIYRRRLMQDGMRAGDIKPLALDRRTDWPAAFGQQDKDETRGVL